MRLFIIHAFALNINNCVGFWPRQAKGRQEELPHTKQRRTMTVKRDEIAEKKRRNRKRRAKALLTRAPAGATENEN